MPVKNWFGLYIKYFDKSLHLIPLYKIASLVQCGRRLLVHFLDSQTQNNHIETILVKSLLGLLALASF